MEPLLVLIGILIVAYVLLYLTGDELIKEKFADANAVKALLAKEESVSYTPNMPIQTQAKMAQEAVKAAQEQIKPSGPYTVLDTSYSQAKPYVTTEDKYGDFEQDVINEKEGGSEATRDAINAARRKLPFDWEQLPPSASRFQQQQAIFVKDVSATAAPFINIQDKETMKALPPDEAEAAAQETAILQAYQPKATADLQSVDAKSVSDLMEKLYAKKGLIPQVVQKSNNVFEIIALQEKNPKIVYEDEVQSSIQTNELNPMIAPNEMIVTPQAVSDLKVGLDPFKNADTNGKLAGRNMDTYNPNLEGVFGQKMSWQQWG